MEKINVSEVLSRESVAYTQSLRGSVKRSMLCSFANLANKTGCLAMSETYWEDTEHEGCELEFNLEAYLLKPKEYRLVTKKIRELRTPCSTERRKEIIEDLYLLLTYKTF